jgi:hypothetical protein
MGKTDRRSSNASAVRSRFLSLFACIAGIAGLMACGSDAGSSGGGSSSGPDAGTPTGGSGSSGSSGSSGGTSSSGGVVSSSGSGSSGGSGSGSSGAGSGGTGSSSGTSGIDGGGPGDAGAKTADAGTPRDGGSQGGADAAGASDAHVESGGPSGPVVAFPGAVGFGRTATGGRGGTVYHVTNLNDSGAGSFRDAVSTGARIVVFDVGGYINLITPVSAKSNLTIAGQTAPGDGVGVMGREVSFSGATNVIAREMRFRQGTLDSDSTKSGINLLNTTTMIFDHVSIEFAQWNNIDSVGASNVTVQHSITADPIGQQFAAHSETGPYTWYGDLFASAHNRCPLAKANTQYVNNVVYNYQAAYTAGNTAGVFSHDVIGNYFIAGPSTTSASDAFFQVNNQPIFNSGNLLDSNADGALNGAPLGNPGGAVVLAAAWSPDTAAIPTSSAAAAYAAVIAGAGASLHRDEVDAQVISEVTSLGANGRLWTSQSQTGLGNGGYGTLNGGTAPTDTDGDGMPDAWESRYGLNPNSAADANGDFDRTGYTNIEKYVNGLVDGSYP